VRKDLSTY